MKDSIKISIIVPIYNAEKYIDRCMESIYNQSFTDYEIILVNDGSTDNSDSICRRYKQKDNRITYISKSNEGAGSARNKGIEVARGDYLAFPDVDDFFESNMYEVLYNASDNGKYDLVISGVNYYSNNNKYKRTELCDDNNYETKDDCRKNVMKFFPISTIFDVPWNKIYKRSIAIENNIRFSNTRRCQDAMFNLDFYDSINNLHSLNKAYYNYIENTQDIRNKKFPINYIDIVISYFNKLKHILSSWGMYIDDIKLHYDTSFVIAIYDILSMFENPYWNLSKKEQKKYICNIMNDSRILDYLKEADIKRNERKKYNIIISKNKLLFYIQYNKEKCVSVIKNNEIIMNLYHWLKKI